MIVDAPFVEGGEVRVKFDFLTENRHALGKGELPALDHGAKIIPDFSLAVEGVEVALASACEAKAVVIS